VPGELETATGGYRYDRRILATLPDFGWTPHLLRLDASFPHPTPAALEQAERALDAIPDGGLTLADGLAFGAMPALAERHARRLGLIALVHHPLAEETGLPAHQVEALRRSETRALAQARLVLTTSEATASLLLDYGVARERVRVIEPGTDSPAGIVGIERSADLRPVSGLDAEPDKLPVPRLLCVAALIPRKGHDLLLHALAQVQDLPWHLDCVGSLDREPAWAEQIHRLRDRLGLVERVTFAGAVSDLELARHYGRAALFVLATRFEGYGMVFAEALAWGIPILATRAGAVPHTVPAEAGLLVRSQDPDAFSAALRLLLNDKALRQRLSAGARSAAQRLPTWEQATAAFAAACSEVGHG